MERADIVIDYAPRPHQLLIHNDPARFRVPVAHRRFGKTVCCVNEIIRRSIACGRPRPRYGYVAPFRTQAKQVAWDYVQHYLKPLNATFNQAELRADYHGRRLTLYGADNPDALRGLYFDGVVLDEFGDIDPRIWTEVIRPALSDRQGWAIFIGTPKGKNAFWELAEKGREGGDWSAHIFKASETGIIPETELKAARDAMPEDQYAQEFECSFEAAIQGAYYGKALKEADEAGRITRVPYDPALPVWTAWDLGIGDSTAIWFAQIAGKEIRLIDFYETSGVGLDHYAKRLREKPYSYEPLLLPHDANARELGTGRSRTETLQSLGFKTKVAPRLGVDDGINAVRTLLPRCWFDEEKTKPGLEALKQYRREWDERMKTFRPRPMHDWTSHAADALRYLATGLPDRVTKPAPRPDKPKWVV